MENGVILRHYSPPDIDAAHDPRARGFRVFLPRCNLNGIGRTFAAILVALAAAAAAAQYPGGGGTGRPGGGGAAPAGKSAQGGQRPPAPETGPASLADQVQIQLGELEEDLRVSPAQRRLWTVFADRVLKLAGDVTRDRDKLRFPKGTAAEQLDFVADKARDRLTAIEDIGDAGKQLYAALSPSQREVADRRLARLAIPLVTNVQGAPARP
jgi:hypothetical protein